MKETASSVRSHTLSPRSPTLSRRTSSASGGASSAPIASSPDGCTRRLERAHDLTLLNYGVLITLVTDPDRGPRMTDLAEGVLTSPSGMTRAVNRLAGEGLVERDQDPDDRRSFIVRLTPLGVARLRDAQMTHHAWCFEMLLDGLDADDLRRLAAIYDRAGG